MFEIYSARMQEWPIATNDGLNMKCSIPSGNKPSVQETGQEVRYGSCIVQYAAWA